MAKVYSKSNDFKVVKVEDAVSDAGDWSKFGTSFGFARAKRWAHVSTRKFREVLQVLSALPECFKNSLKIIQRVSEVDENTSGTAPKFEVRTSNRPDRKRMESTRFKFRKSSMISHHQAFSCLPTGQNSEISQNCCTLMLLVITYNLQLVTAISTVFNFRSKTRSVHLRKQLPDFGLCTQPTAGNLQRRIYRTSKLWKPLQQANR